MYSVTVHNLGALFLHWVRVSEMPIFGHTGKNIANARKKRKKKQIVDLMPTLGETA